MHLVEAMSAAFEDTVFELGEVAVESRLEGFFGKSVEQVLEVLLERRERGFRGRGRYLCDDGTEEGECQKGNTAEGTHGCGEIEIFWFRNGLENQGKLSG